MTDVRERALALAAHVWEADIVARDVWPGPAEAEDIFALADAFIAWLSLPNPAARLSLSASAVRPIDPER